MSGIVTCSSSPSFAKFCSLRARLERASSFVHLLRIAASAASAPRRDSSFARISTTGGLELGDLLLEARPRLHAHRVVVVGERGDLRLQRLDAADQRVELRGDAVDLDALARRRSRRGDRSRVSGSARSCT